MIIKSSSTPCYAAQTNHVICQHSVQLTSGRTGEYSPTGGKVCIRCIDSLFVPSHRRAVYRSVCPTSLDLYISPDGGKSIWSPLQYVWYSYQGLSLFGERPNEKRHTVYTNGTWTVETNSPLLLSTITKQFERQKRIPSNLFFFKLKREGPESLKFSSTLHDFQVY